VTLYTARREADTDKRIDSYMTKNSAEDFESNLSDMITLSYFTISYSDAPKAPDFCYPHGVI
jgi:hypothetical protein